MITKMEAYSQWPSAPVLPMGAYTANDDPVVVKDVQGIGPVKSNIVSAQSATGRGELPQGKSTGKRNIVLTLGLNPDWQDQTISSLRQLLYAYFMPEQWCKLRFHSDELPTVDIEGDVESFEPNIFAQDPEYQVSIICYRPDFVDIDATIYTGVVDDGSTELEFDYIGSVATGLELRVARTVDLPNYTGSLTARLAWESEATQILAVNPVTIDTTKYFKLSTVKQMKRVQNVSVADGAITNLLNRVVQPPDWLEVKPGQNVFSLAAASPGQAWTLAYYNRFGGL